MRSSLLPTLGALTGVAAACVCAAALWPSGAQALGCPPSTSSPANDFSISASPSTVSVDQGKATTTPTVSTTVTTGTAVPLCMQVSGLPAGTTWSLKPTPAGSQMTSASTAKLWLVTSGTTPCGSYPVTITANDASSGRGGATHSTQLQLSVACPDFSISANPSAVSVAPGGTAASATISTAVTKAPAQPVSLSVGGLPKDAVASFSPSTVTAGGTSTLTVLAWPSTPCSRSPTNVTITATGPFATQTMTLPVKVTGDCILNGDFADGLTDWTGSSSDGWGDPPQWFPNETVAEVADDPDFGHAVIFRLATNPYSTKAYGRLEQTFTAPPHARGLSLWYRNDPDPGDPLLDCGHPTLTDETTGRDVTPKLALPMGSMQQFRSGLDGGHTYTLALNSRATRSGCQGNTKYADVTID